MFCGSQAFVIKTVCRGKQKTHEANKTQARVWSLTLEISLLASSCTAGWVSCVRCISLSPCIQHALVSSSLKELHLYRRKHRVRVYIAITDITVAVSSDVTSSCKQPAMFSKVSFMSRLTRHIMCMSQFIKTYFLTIKAYRHFYYKHDRVYYNPSSKNTT